MVWPNICAYFGLEEAGRQDGEVAGEAWVRSQEGHWAEWEKASGIKSNIMRDATWEFLTTIAQVQISLVETLC